MVKYYVFYAVFKVFQYYTSYQIKNKSNNFFYLWQKLKQIKPVYYFTIKTKKNQTGSLSQFAFHDQN